MSTASHANATRSLQAHHPAASRRRPRLSHKETLLVDALSPGRKATLGPLLYDIFCESYGALSMETVCDEIIFRPGARIPLFVDERGVVVGFGSVRVVPFEVDGRTVGIVEAGVYIRRGFSAGAQAIRWGLLEPLRFKLLNPFTPLYYVMEALTPVSYRRGRRTLNTVWPNPEQELPPEAQSLLSAVLRARGLKNSGAHPAVARYPDPASHQNAGHVRHSNTLADDPDVNFYLKLNPNFAQGDILCTVSPFTLRELALSYLRSLR